MRARLIAIATAAIGVALIVAPHADAAVRYVAPGVRY